jgi:aspartate ammonia-lyase
MAIATALVPKLGYSNVSKLARRSVEEERPLLEILDAEGILQRADALDLIRAASKPVFGDK